MSKFIRLDAFNPSGGHLSVIINIDAVTSVEKHLNNLTRIFVGGQYYDCYESYDSIAQTFGFPLEVKADAV